MRPRSSPPLRGCCCCPACSPAPSFPTSFASPNARQQAGYQIGRLTAINILGAIAGALLAGFVAPGRIGTVAQPPGSGAARRFNDLLAQKRRSPELTHADLYARAVREALMKPRLIVLLPGETDRLDLNLMDPGR